MINRISKWQMVMVGALWLGVSVCAQEISKVWDGSLTTREKYNYPMPPTNNRSLFFIQRSSNANTIVYEGNILSNGEYDPEKPVDVFWIRYDEEGQRKGLNFIQRKLAYGVVSEPSEDGKNYVVNLVSYKKRNIYVVKNQQGKVQAHMEINGKLAKFNSVFVEIERNFFIPDVSFIEIFGEDLETGEAVYERFIP